MSTDLNICHATKSGNIITCAGRGAYVSFFTPRKMKGDDKAEPKYQGSLLIPAKADIKLLTEAVNEAITAKWGADAKKKGRIKVPFIKTEDQVHNYVKEDDDDIRAKFCKELPFLIRCSSKERPDVLYANGQRVDDEDEVYSGRWMRFSVRPYAWEHPANGKGVSFGLQNAQILQAGERFGGGRVKAEDEFSAVKLDGDGNAEPWE